MGVVDELHLTRDDCGHFRVYAETSRRPPQGEVLDGIRGAVSMAEYRHRWSAKGHPAWDDGPDPRRDPDWYDDGDEDGDEDEPGSFG